ncbi:MAG: sarcosine oxidase subunit gamma family protein [Pseudomonadota bacterium]
MSERLMDGIVELSERPLRGMITLRGDLSRAGLRKAVETGVPMPERGRITQSGARAAAWMSLDELLLMSPHDQVSSDVRVLRAALQDSHHLVQDVSDARAVFRLEGPDGREVLSKLCPVDLRPGLWAWPFSPHADRAGALCVLDGERDAD